MRLRINSKRVGYLLRSTMIFPLVSMVFCFVSCGICTGQGVSDNKDGSVAEKWFDSKEWLGGLNILPDKSINKAEIYKQYNENKQWWDAAFKFLRENDLKNLRKGFYKIDSNNVYAMVNIGRPLPSDSIAWESHKHYNDLQYIVFGSVKMGDIPIGDPRITIKDPYNGKHDIAHYVVGGEKSEDYLVADSSSFFIFSPKDVHKAGVAIDGVDSVKRIIIKIRTGE